MVSELFRAAPQLFRATSRELLRARQLLKSLKSIKSISPWPRKIAAKREFTRFAYEAIRLHPELTEAICLELVERILQGRL